MRNYLWIFSLSCMGNDSKEEIIEEPCEDEPYLISEETDIWNDTVTKTYKICSSDIPTLWDVSVEEFFLELNKNNVCSWYDDEMINREGEPFAIEMKVERYVTLEVFEFETILGQPGVKTTVDIEGTIIFSQNGHTHEASLGSTVYIQHDGDAGMSTNFEFGSVALPEDVELTEPFRGRLLFYDNEGFLYWDPNEGGEVSRIEILASYESDEYQRDQAICISIE